MFDYDGDGLKDLWVGEFETGPSMIKVFKNVGTNEAPEFSGESEYAKTVYSPAEERRDLEADE